MKLDVPRSFMLATKVMDLSRRVIRDASVMMLGLTKDRPMRGGRVRQRSVGEVVSRVTDAERHLGWGTDRQRWFTSSRTLVQNLRSPRSFLSAARNRVVFPTCLRADRVVVKNNIIAFYLDDRRILKLFEDIDALRQHMAGLEGARSRWDFLRVPATLHCEEHPIAYVAEQFIEGRSPESTDLSVHASRICEDLEHLHFDDGAEWLATEVAPGWGREMRRRMIEAGIPAELLPHRVEKLAGQTYELLTSTVHGDLSVGNMLTDGSTVWVLDWEGFGPGYVCEDIRGLLSLVPSLEIRYETRIRDLAGRSRVCPQVRPQIGLRTLQRLCCEGYLPREYFIRRDGTDRHYGVALSAALSSIRAFVQWAEQGERC